MELLTSSLPPPLIVAAAIVAFALRRPAAPETATPDPRLDTLIAAQGEIAGQFSQTVAAQAELQTHAGRADGCAGQASWATSLTDSATKTAATIAGIGERLTVIDEAQKNISALSGQVVSLQQVLSNKQARGAFGQGRRWKRSCATACPAGALRFPVHAFQPQPARLRHPHSRHRRPSW